ncbi:src-like-adapter [Salmo salar]|uniref:Src-like-adapter n=1 Tax=Salmo salar TaxID=8030 RepID=B5X1H3_SALSA|nr:src-like-adapter [Salmo salar]XP_045565397.1 src-like-adapter [Salmo salar]ACI33154.1 SRC-like-adapter [Salmo salar]|eukprot:XP_014034045.1 PREDICTED: src-like-adapter [Salmo salar]
MGNVMRGGENRNKTNTNCHDNALKGEDDTLVVLHDYPFPDISEPIFKMGEKLRVLSQEGNWWRVRSGQSGRENYIPNNYVAKVYHGWLFEGVARQKAEELLRLPGNRVGSFMIRESTQQRGVYSMSVKHRSIKHYKIYRLENNGWYYISPRLTFQCLEEMVNHYCDSADGLCCVLTGPCLCGTANLLDTTTQPPPVVMRHNNFDWKKVDRKDLISAGAPQGQQNRDTMVSYGVRNSIASYLSLAGAPGPRQQQKNHKKKNKSVYVTSHSLSHMDLEEDYDT